MNPSGGESNVKASSSSAPSPDPGDRASRLILGSASPARAELLRNAGLVFEQQASRADEPPRESGEALGDYVVRLSRLKLDTLRTKFPDRYLITADTDIELDGEILGKPANEEQAVAMITRMAGRAHHLCSGVAVCNPDGEIRTAQDEAFIQFVAMDETAVCDYVSRTRPFRYAGAYAIQAEGADLVDSVRGRMDTVIGIPVPQTLDLLAGVGYR